MGNSGIGMDGPVFARQNSLVQQSNRLVLVLLGFVMIVVGIVEGQNVNITTTSNESTQPVTLDINHPTPVGVFNGQLVINNSASTDAPTTIMSSTGQIVNQDASQSTVMSNVTMLNDSSHSMSTTISSSGVTTTPFIGSSAMTITPSNTMSSSGVTTMSSSGVTTMSSSGVTTMSSSGVTTMSSNGVTTMSSSGVTTAPTSGSMLSSSESSSTGQSMSTSASDSTSMSSTPASMSSTPTSSGASNSNVSQNTTGQDPGQDLYAKCQMKMGTVCFGDKRNCIHSGNCTFLGAISENDSFINVQLLTRTYDPPYHGVNLTVELSREKKGNNSVIRCSRPRFKSFKIRLTWTNKTSYEPGNETKLSSTLIDKNQLKAECLADQEKNNFTIPPSKTLALKFYIVNNNDSSSTLVSQGLSQVSIQEPMAQSSNITNNGGGRSGRLLNSDTTQKTPEQSKEDSLYQMCLNNTAKCFGDVSGCTENHNCTFLGVIKENVDNYHVYVVTKAYPTVNQVLTLTLNAPTDNTSNSIDVMNNNGNNTSKSGNASDIHIDCGRPDFKDLSVQSTWKYTKLPLALISQSTNGSEILETTVDKMTIKNSCESYLQDHSNGTEDIIEEPNFLFKYQFHLENGTLVPLGFSNQSDTGNVTAYAFGLNGTAYLVSDNKGQIIMTPDDDAVTASPVQENSSPKTYLSSLILCFSAWILMYPSSM